MLQGKNSRNFGESSVGNLFRSGRTFKLLGSRWKQAGEREREREREGSNQES